MGFVWRRHRKALLLTQFYQILSKIIIYEVKYFLIQRPVHINGHINDSFI